MWSMAGTGSIALLSGGFLLVYLSQKLSSMFPKAADNTSENKANTSLPPSIKQLVDSVFPFSFIPENSNQEQTVSMSNRDLDLLIQSLRDMNLCKQAILNEMLFHKIARVIREGNVMGMSSREFVAKERQVHTWYVDLIGILKI